MDLKCRLCLFKTDRGESVNIFTPDKNNVLISETIMSFVPIELSPDDNLPQAICNVCVQKLNSIIEFRMIILSSDAQLKSQKIIVTQKSENQVCGDSASYESEEVKLDIHDVKLEAETEIKFEPDDTIKEQNSKRTVSKGGPQHRGYERQRNKKLYKCERCDKTFPHKSRYIVHNRSHTGERPFCCDICNKGFATKSFMVYHKRIHLDERPFKCDECTKAFRTL
jgi:hypothetical protein